MVHHINIRCACLSWHLRIGAAALIAVAAIGAPHAAAQSLKEMRAQSSEEKALREEAAFTSQTCGRSVSASIEWRSARNWPDGQSLAKSCDGALGALEAVCRAQDGKARTSAITNFVCSGDGAGPSINGNTLRYGASPGDNGFAATKKLLDSEL